MFRANLAGLTLGLALFSFIATPAQAESGRTAMTPLAMQLFCASNPGECRGGANAVLAMSPDLSALLERTNKSVNGTIRPGADAADIWRLNPASGDCEDYALSKRSALIRDGLPSGALRIAYTHTRRGTPHVVLIVRTSQGDYVLDNLSNRIRTLRASGYVVRSMSSAHPLRWVSP